jgi:hypothetical protein
LTKAQYIKAADRICDSYGKRITSIVNAAGSSMTLERARKTFQEKLIPLFRGQLAELRQLKPPRADFPKLYTDFLLALSSGINTIDGRVAGAKSLSDLNAINPTGLERAKRAAAAYGMKVC